MLKRTAQLDSTGTQLTVNADARTMELVKNTSTSITTHALVNAITLHQQK
jgi:hypothetical protein